MNELNRIKVEIENGYEQLEKELSSASQSQIEEYERIRKLYENSKTVALELRRNIIITEDRLKDFFKQDTKWIIILCVIALLFVLFDTSLIIKIAALLFIAVIAITTETHEIRARTSWERKMVDRDEINLQLIVNDMRRYGIDKFNHQVGLHYDFGNYEEKLISEGLTKDDIEKDEILEEKFRKLELENVEILIEIIENVKSNKRHYYVEVEK